MENMKRLEAEGAYLCGGALVYHNQKLGYLRVGGLELTPEGAALLEKLEGVTDVVAKPAKSHKKKVALPEDDPLLAELAAI